MGNLMPDCGKKPPSWTWILNKPTVLTSLGAAWLPHEERTWSQEQEASQLLHSLLPDKETWNLSHSENCVHISAWPEGIQVTYDPRPPLGLCLCDPFAFSYRS